MKDYADSHIYDRIAYVLYYFSVLLIFIGICGNLVSFGVFCSRKFQNTTFSFYMRVKLIVDTFILLYRLNIFSSKILNWNIVMSSWIFCKFTWYLVYICFSLSFWILSLFSFDCLIKLANPAKFSFIINSRKFQIITVASILAFYFVIFLPFLMNIELNENRFYKCYIKNISLHNFYDFLLLFEEIIVLYGLNTIFTVMNIYFLNKLRRNKIESNGFADSINIIRESRFAKISITLNLINFICHFPLIIFLIFVRLGQFNFDFLNLFSSKIYILIIIKSGCNLFIYLSFCPIFKEEFFRIIRFKRESKSVSISNFVLLENE